MLNIFERGRETQKYFFDPQCRNDRFGTACIYHIYIYIYIYRVGNSNISFLSGSSFSKHRGCSELYLIGSRALIACQIHLQEEVRTPSSFRGMSSGISALKK